MPPVPAPGAVVFDCDGVLLDSNTLKVELFRETVEQTGFAPADVERFSAYQAANFGTSRFALFEELLSWDLEVRPDIDRDALVDHYASLLGTRYAKAPETSGMRDAVTALGARVPLYVVSGSAQEELRGVFRERGDLGMFVDVLGSPTRKSDNLQTVVNALAVGPAPLAANDVVFVGDAEADLKAAATCGVRFVYMDGYSTVQPRMRALAQQQRFPMIADLRELPTLLSLTA
jgi:phosphoglycolate phosphatase-like HAD superfamily hydrolase